MATDIRVIIINFADRLPHLHSLNFHSKERQQHMAPAPQAHEHHIAA